MPCDTSLGILGDNVSAKHNDILFELLLYSYNHNTSEFTLWQATGNSQVKNVNPILANASDTGLPDQSINLAFIFGLRYIAGGLENLISEMYRILKPEGVLSFEKTRGSEKKLIEDVEREGFIYSGRKARIFLFEKCQGDGSSDNKKCKTKTEKM